MESKKDDIKVEEKLLLVRGKGIDQAWWHTPVIPVLERLKQKNHCEFEDVLGYIMSSRPV